MSDDVDVATEIMQERLDRALAQRITISIKQSAYECDECGDEIPEARRQAVAGTQHCTKCASIMETKGKFNFRVAE
ncbi:MAG TPA: TraR/DksA C4-type zinc finger protein [Cellvibrio sp.]|nr:TraR/DksA C4-type zinc finger protein [Cellvibrio sp.]